MMNLFKELNAVFLFDSLFPCMKLVVARHVLGGSARKERLNNVA
jgi:hypothetical protein